MIHIQIVTCRPRSFIKVIPSGAIIQGMRKLLILSFAIVAVAAAVFVFVRGFNGPVAAVPPIDFNPPVAVNPPAVGPPSASSSEPGTVNPVGSDCVCPAGYIKEGDACNPKCYYSVPKCLMPSLLCKSQSGGVGTVPSQGKCGIENCHGLDIKCGPNPAEVCNMMYMLGDKCRKYASCGYSNGVCGQITDPRFDVCKACVEKCSVDYKSDQSGSFNCEAKC